MPPKITRNHEYAKVLSRTVKTNRGFTSLANKVDAIDSADVTQILSTISASTLEVYDTLDSLPTSSLTKGGQGYVKATQRLYVSDSFGWYSMALVNLSPTQTLDPSGNVTLSTDGTSTIVTITATDSDQPESQLSYSVESDGNMLATGTTVTQDSSVFTITPLTYAGGGVSGNFTLTFKTTDNVNIATTTKDFSLALSPPYSSKIASESTAPFIYFSFKEQIGTDANSTLYSSFTNQGSGGSTYDLTLHTNANRPEADTDATITGGTKVLSFNGNDNLRFNNYAMPGSWTFVFIGHCSSTRLIAFGGKNNPTFLGYYQANNTGVLARNEQDVGMTQASLSSTSTMKTFVVRLDGDTLDYWDNSSTKVNYSTTFYTNNFNIGCVGGRQYSGSLFQPSVGYLGDIAIYNTALSDADCAAMASALNTKYNV